MKYNNHYFEAIIAIPGCGKSYLCDKYPQKFVDVDEERLKLKYYVPENITRDELENTKGERPFQRRHYENGYTQKLFEKLDKEREKGKILIAAPHPESFDYFASRNIKFCYVFAGKDMKEEVKQRMLKRGNPQYIINENYDNFENFYIGNIREDRAEVKYIFGKGEYLEEILKKFDCEFLLKQN